MISTFETLSFLEGWIQSINQPKIYSRWKIFREINLLQEQGPKLVK